MANSLQEVAPKILAQGLLALREQAVMPLLVNRSYEEEARQKGESVNVPIPSGIPVTDVEPGINAPAPTGISPSSVVIPLDQWKEAAFTLTDKDILIAMEGTVPMQVSEAIASLATEVDDYILKQYVDVYGFSGTPGTTPFSGSPGTTTIANQAGRVLNEQKAPNANRRFVINPAAEAAALDLRAFQDMSFSGNAMGIINGEIGQKLGFTFHMDQNVVRHETGAALTGWLVDGALVKNANLATKTSTVEIDAAGALAVPIKGDILTFAGHDQTYVVKSYVVKSSTSGTLVVSPPLKEAIADDAAITFKASHTVNLAFHRDAIAFAQRPLGETSQGLGGIMMSQMDELTGLGLRVEIRREFKQIRFSYDLLYGAAIVRPELITRVAG